MLVLFPVCTRDQDLALENAKWMQELGGCGKHEVLFLHDKRCNTATVMEISSVLNQSFSKVHEHITGAQIDGWPQGANYMFRVCMSLIEHKPYRYFCWMEPDAIPLKEDWLDIIEAEFIASKKPFMGDRVQVENVPLHMSGIGVYPNPIYELAGEAYRAADTAWDMSAAHQIVPKAHFTKLIEHAWKHPTFTDLSELKTQIRPEAVIFHSSKDGSLIFLLREQRGRNLTLEAATKESDKPGSPSPSSFLETLEPFPQNDSFRQATEPGPIDAFKWTKPPVATKVHEPNAYCPCEWCEEWRNSHPQPKINCDIFIRTYPPDYPWLLYCVRAIRKFATGFRRVVIVSPQLLPVEGTDWRVMNEESEDGYLSQQIHKLYADVITDYKSDYILHIDSDVILTQPITPESFFTQPQNQKLIWPYTPYSAIETPWQAITEKFVGVEVKNEFMRRFPIMIPRWLYSFARDHCYHKHGLSISEYVKRQPHRAFSEFNALGALAWIHHHDKFEWVNTLSCTLPIPFANQYRSWDGITDEIKNEIEGILSGVADAQPTNATSSTPHPAFTGEQPISPAQKTSCLTSSVNDIVAETPAGEVHTIEKNNRKNVRVPVVAFPGQPSQAMTMKEMIEMHVNELRTLADQSAGNRIQVGKRLSSAGLTKPKRRKAKR